MIIVDDINDIVGKVISNQRPYVKILAKPRLEVYELVPGFVKERWEVLAQVEESLCIIELRVTPNVIINGT